MLQWMKCACASRWCTRAYMSTRGKIVKHQPIVLLLNIGACAVFACGDLGEASSFRSFDGASEPADGLHLSAFARELDGKLEVLCVKPDWASDADPGTGFTNPAGGWVSFTLLDLNEDPPTPWEQRERKSAPYVAGQKDVRWLIDMPTNGHYALGCEALPTDFQPAEDGFEWQCPVPNQPGVTGVCTRSSPYYFSVFGVEPPSGDECGESTQLCTGMIAWESGTYPYYVLCDSLRQGVVHVQGSKEFRGNLTIDTPDDLGHSTLVERGENVCLSYEMPAFDWTEAKDPVCRVVLHVESAGRARLSAFAPDKGPAECHGGGTSEPTETCHQKCLDRDSTPADLKDCDCTPYEVNACSPYGSTCGIPFNIEVGEPGNGRGYNCPFYETDIEAQVDMGHCLYWEDDTGAFEHEGTCYRCGDGQQCCYTDGKDNGTGSFDFCPPFPDEQHRCTDPLPGSAAMTAAFDHCNCDVVPLCGCMASTIGVEACEDCIGPETWWDAAKGWWFYDDIPSCNAPGIADEDFCSTAQSQDGWCDIVATGIPTCLDYPS